MKPFIASRRHWIAIFLVFCMLHLLSASSNLSQDRPGDAATGASVSNPAGDGSGSFEMETNPVPKLKKKKSILPVLISLVVLAAAGYAFYKIITKNPTLTVTLAPGVTGTPEAGIHQIEKNSEVSYSYSANKVLQVRLDGAIVSQTGTFKMRKDLSLDVSTTDSVEENFYDLGTPPSSYWTPRVASEWFFSNSRYSCRTSVDNWHYNVFNFQWPQQNYTVSLAMLPDPDRVVIYGILLATTNNMRSASGYYVAFKRNKFEGQDSVTNFSIWKFKDKDLNTDIGAATPIKNWIYKNYAAGWLDSKTVEGLQIVRKGNTYQINGFAGVNAFKEGPAFSTIHPIHSFTDSSFDPRYIVILFESRSIPTQFECFKFFINPN